MEEAIIYRLERLERKYKKLKIAFVGGIITALFGSVNFSVSVTASKQVVERR